MGLVRFATAAVLLIAVLLGDYILLANLLDRTVSVTHVIEKNAFVARSIEVLDKP